MTNRRLATAMMALLFSLATAAMAAAADPAAKPDSGSKPDTASSASQSSASGIKGQVLKVEPDALILGNDGGGQVRLKVDKDTKMEQPPKVGDKVEAVVGPERNAIAVKPSERAQEAQEQNAGQGK